MTSIQMREDSLFMRNAYRSVGKYGIPLVKKQEIDLINIELIPCSNARYNDSEENRAKGIHFFVDDYRFEGIYDNPERTLARYSQYSYLLTPDFSTYAEMNIWRQIESVAMNRWCGAYWQSKGLTVIPTISWSTPRSFDFCFDGVESESIVAVGMIGCKNNRLGYMRGYNAMLEKISPKAIICLGSPFPEMEGNIISVDYTISRKGGH